jgi:hypothetical protein
MVFNGADNRFIPGRQGPVPLRKPGPTSTFAG